MFKTGDVVRVVRNVGSHSYYIGQIITLGKEHGASSQTWHGGNSSSPWVQAEEIELVRKRTKGFANFVRRLECPSETT